MVEYSASRPAGVPHPFDGRSTAVHPQNAAAAYPRAVTATSGLERAQVKWFNRLRGFGFLTEARVRPTSSCTWKPCAATD